MRTVDVARMLAPILMIGVSIVLAARRRVVRAFERAGADAPERALAPEAGRGLDRWWLQRLTAAGVIARAPDGRCWIRRESWARYRAVRRRRGIAIAGAVVALGALYLLG